MDFLRNVVSAVNERLETLGITGFKKWLFAALIAHYFYKRLSKPGRPDKYYIVRRPKTDYRFLGKAPPTLEQIDDVVAEMRTSFSRGTSLPIKKRLEQLRAMRRLFTENESALLKALKDDLHRPRVEGLVYDVLVPISELDHMIDHVEEYSAPEEKGFSILTFPSSAYLYKEPFGVVLVIGTWNYPIMLSLVPIMGAIAAGNCVVYKPCNTSGSCAKLLAELLGKYMDPHVVTVVGHNLPGDRHTTAALLKCKFDHIFFTGSPTVGRVIMRGAAEHLTPVTLELGGKNPVFVDESVDVDLAAKRTVWGRMMNAGQQCISPDFVLCHKKVVEKFKQKCVHYIKTLYGKDPKANGQFGRIVGDKQFQRVQRMLANHGGEVIYGAEVDEKERYISPTIVQIDLNSPSLDEETFGPILWVVPIESMQKGIEFLQSRPKPLSLYIFSNNTRQQQQILYNTSAGGVTVNGTLLHVGHPDLPFGGVGDSGMSSYHGRQTYDTFCHKKPVLVKPKWLDGGLLSDPFFVYPPWNKTKEKILRFLMKFA